MSTIELGRLETVELRDKFPKEAGDFTPWLAQEKNLKLLGDTIGIDLELEAQEKSVGPFSADILCKRQITLILAKSSPTQPVWMRSPSSGLRRHLQTSTSQRLTG